MMRRLILVLGLALLLASVGAFAADRRPRILLANDDGIEAKPATCVRLALASLLTEKPDLVVSGINRGDNAGLTIYVSGTLGAAREAAFDGIPSIAASLVTSPGMD